MSVFTVEVAGRPIACIRADSQQDAEQAAEDPWFRDGLLGLEQDGRPVWGGDEDLHLRQATADELRLIEQRAPAEQDESVVFLVEQGDVSSSNEHKLILASRVEDAPAYNQAGERIGHIDDLSIDRRSGKVVYAIMSFGGFLGIGKRFHPVPWNVLHYDPEMGGYVVPLDKAELRDAPHYEADELRKLGGPAFGGYDPRILEYYGRFGPPMI